MGFMPGDFGAMKLTLASPLQGVALTPVGACGTKYSMPTPTPPEPPCAHTVAAISKTAMIAVAVLMVDITLPPVVNVSNDFHQNSSLQYSSVLLIRPVYSLFAGDAHPSGPVLDARVVRAFASPGTFYLWLLGG
jgi:hypothetical protein